MNGLPSKQHLVVLHPHLDYPGGASKYMLEVSRRLADRGTSVYVVLTRYDKKLVRSYKKIQFIEIGGPSTGEISFWLTFPLFIFKLKRILDEIPNKVLFPQIFPPVWWASAYKFFSPKTKIVWMCQEPSAFIHSPLVITSLPQPMKTFVKILNPLLKLIDEFLVKKIDLVIANSNNGASLIKKIYQRKADLIAYPSVDLNTFKPYRKKKNYIFTVSRLDKQKNIDFLIRAFGLLPGDLQDKYEFVIGGSGEEKNSLEDLANKLGIGKKVKFLGWIEEKKLPRWYAESKLAVFCGQDEPFGIIPVEAMASGTPVVALKSGGVVESIVDGQTGTLVKNKDEKEFSEAVRNLLEDQDGLLKMAKNARAHIEKNFSWDKTADEIYQFLKGAISEE